MSGNPRLRESVMEAIRKRKLPNGRPGRTWAGPGCGACCDICGQPIRADQPEYELEFSGSDHGDQPRDYHVHLGCYTVWESEHRKLASERDARTAVNLSAPAGETRLGADEREAPRNRGPA